MAKGPMTEEEINLMVDKAVPENTKINFIRCERF